MAHGNAAEQFSGDFSDNDAANDNVEYSQLRLVKNEQTTNPYAAMRGQGGRTEGYYETNGSSANRFDYGESLDDDDLAFIKEQNLDAVEHLGPMMERIDVLQDIIETGERSKGPVNRAGYINRLRSHFPDSTVAREVIRQLEKGHGDMNDFAKSVGDAVRYGAMHLSQETAQKRFEAGRTISKSAIETARQTIAQTGGLSPIPGQNGQRIDDAVANYRNEKTVYPEPRPLTAKPTLWSRAVNKVSSLAEKTSEKVSSVRNYVAEKAMSVVNSANSTINKVAESVAPTVTSVGSEVKKGVSTVMSKVSGWFKGLSGGKSQEAFAY